MGIFDVFPIESELILCSEARLATYGIERSHSIYHINIELHTFVVGGRREGKLADRLNTILIFKFKCLI